MEQLHFVGFTSDNEALMFSHRDDAWSGEFFVQIDEYLLAAIQQDYEIEGADSGEEGGRRASPVLVRHPKPASDLSPREIQARLRSGSSVAEVADEAGVDEEWVLRFADPILAEQARVVEQAQRLTFTKPRVGPSAQPLRTSVRWNLAEQGALRDDEVFDAGWSAYNVRGARWMVRLSFVAKRRRKFAEWEVDLRSGELTARNRVATDLGYVAPGRRRRGGDPESSLLPSAPGRAGRPGVKRATKAATKAAKAKRATKAAKAKRAAERPSTATRRASGGRKSAGGRAPWKSSATRPAKTSAKKAGRQAAARRPAKKSAAKKSAAKKSAAKKSAAKKSAAKKAAAKKVTAEKAVVKKATAKKATAKKAVVKKAAAKKATPRRSTAQKATPRRSTAKKVAKGPRVVASERPSHLARPPSATSPPTPTSKQVVDKLAASASQRRLASPARPPAAAPSWPAVAAAPRQPPARRQPPPRPPAPQRPPLVIMSTPESGGDGERSSSRRVRRARRARSEPDSADWDEIPSWVAPRRPG